MPPPVPVLSDMDGARSAIPEKAPEPTPVIVQDSRKSEEYYQTKSMIFGARGGVSWSGGTPPLQVLVECARARAGALRCAASRAG